MVPRTRQEGPHVTEMLLLGTFFSFVGQRASSVRHLGFLLEVGLINPLQNLGGLPLNPLILVVFDQFEGLLLLH